MHYQKLFRLFQKYPKDYPIKNPGGLVLTRILIPKHLRKFLRSRESKIFFTRKSLKHLSEKQGGDFLLQILPKVISSPDKVYQGKVIDRLLFSRAVTDQGNRTYVISLEGIRNSNIVIITIFKTDEDYLENFEILWRAGTP